MKNKIVMITAALAVMMALTGIAAADYSVAFVKGTFDISDSKTDNSGLTYGDDVGGYTHYAVRTNNAAGLISVQACSISIETTCPTTSTTPTTGSTGWVTANTYSTGFYANLPTEDVKIYTFGTVDGKIFVHINNGETYDLLGDEAEAIATANVKIPEFSTVAIPIAAVLGLVFFFQQRKNKKE